MGTLFYSPADKVYHTPSENTTRWIVGGIVWSLGVINASILVYGLCYFRRVRQKGLAIIQKRYPNLIVMEAWVQIILLYFFNPVTQLTIGEFDELQPDIRLLVWIISTMAINALALITINLEATRLYLIYYQLNHIHALNAVEWKKKIDETAMQANWWIQNAGKYGNLSWIGPKSVFVTVFEIVICSVMAAIRISFTRTVGGMFFGTASMLILFVYFKCPPTNDSFMFYREFQLSAYIMLFGFVAYNIIFMATFFVLPADTTLKWMLNEGIELVVTYSMSLVAIMSALYIPSIILKNYKKFLSHKSHKTLGKLENDMLNTKIEMEPQSQQSASKSHTFVNQLYDILGNNDFLNKFAKFLILEFSLECLTSYIEIVQFKISYYNKFKDELPDKETNENTEANKDEQKKDAKDAKDAKDSKEKGVSGDPILKSVQKNTDIPQSTIVTKNADNYKEIVWLLYHKYMSKFAQDEINISNSLRNRYKYLLEDKAVWMANENYTSDKESLYVLFDPVIEEMQRLMIASVYRFIDSNS